MYYINSSTDKPNISNMLNIIINKVRVRGIKIKDVSQMRGEIQQQLDEITTDINCLTGINNPRSPKQVKEYFESLTDADTIKFCRDDKDNIITDKASLISLADLGRQDAILILKHRKLASKLNVLKQLVSDKLNIIRPNVSLLLSNRINYTEPALMNIHKEVLWYVIKPFDEEKNNLWSVDIKNQEPHIMAYFLNIPQIKSILADNNSKGLYESLFEIIYPDEEFTQTKRNEFKTAWNALSYGCGSNTVRNTLKQLDYKKVVNYFKSLSGMKLHKARCKKIANSGRNTITTYFGTELESDKVGNELVRSLMDLAIQGTGADILALLIEHFYKWKESNANGSLIDIYFTRHDELILEVSKELPDDIVCNILSDIFVHKIDDWQEFSIKIKKINE